MSEREGPGGPGERSNNNRRAGAWPEGAWPDGDANANALQEEEDEGRTGDASALSRAEEPDRIIIWGTDSQCDDPELVEFEMLECQELEAYLVEEGEEDFGGLGPGKEACGRTLSNSGAAGEPAPDKSAGKEEEEEEAAARKTTRRGACEQEGGGGAGGGTVAGLGSETGAFACCLSAMSSLGGSLASALDAAGRTHATDRPVPPAPYRTTSEDLSLAQSITPLSDGTSALQPAERHPKSTTNTNYVDLNLNTTAPTREAVSEAQVRVVVGRCEERRDDVNDEHNQNLQQRYKLINNNTVLSEREREAEVGAGKTAYESATDHEAQHAARKHEEGPRMTHTCCQTEDTPDTNHNPPRAGTKAVQTVDSKAIKKQGSLEKTLPRQGSFDRTLRKQPSFDKTLKKQGSFEHGLQKQGSFENSRSSSPSSLERRKPWGSPSRPATPPSPKTSWSPKKKPLPGSPAKVVPRDASQEHGAGGSPQRGAGVPRQPPKVGPTSGIPKPAPPPHQKEPDTKKSPPAHKPKNVRPKIITSVRQSPQVRRQVTDGPYEVSTAPPRFSYPSPPAHKEPKVGPQPTSSPVLCSSNLLFDKYRQDLQKAGMGPGVKPPANRGGKPETFHGELPEGYPHELPLQEAAGLYRSPRALRPQLGLGAVASRPPSAKIRGHQAGQRSSVTPSQPALAGAGPTHSYQEPTAEQRRTGSEPLSRSLLPKPGQSGLRPPGFSLPAPRLAALDAVRSASISSVSSSQSGDSSHGDPCRPSLCPSSDSDDASLQRATAPPSDASRPGSSSGPLPPNTPALQRRPLLPPPRGSPQATRKEAQREVEMVRPGSSPKKFAVVSPKPQSPGQGRAGAGRGPGPESERSLVQKLRERCEQQAGQLQSLQARLRNTTLGLDAFAITAQHFSLKSESAIVKERELSLELSRLRDEVACSVARWERVQREKVELELRVEAELQRLQQQHRSQRGALEERLRGQHAAHTQRLQAQQGARLEQLRCQHQEQMEEMNESQEAALSEMETTHSAAMDTLREEHARTVKNLKMAHEQQRRSLEADFEKLRLSLQDQVDTLTFQNRSLRDRAKRFEEALRRSTDEQIVDALAPYQHIEEDLKSLKDVLEMKNQQIHEQEQKISELEKMAQKNVFLEERVQVLQQQNEDLKARIDKNLAMSRQLSEENANLQVHVEKESNEKKRLSRTNEELLWRLQTGEVSPHMSPCSSPIHRASSGPGSPARPLPSPARPHSFHQ